MAMQYDYFSAPTDDIAASLIDAPGGPTQVSAQPNGTPAWDTLSVNGVEPSVHLVELEEIMTGVDFNDLLDTPRAGSTLHSSADNEAIISTVSDALQAVLADAEDEALAAVAVEWSHSEEFGGDANPADIATFLHNLAGLARRARSRGERLYCWVSF